MANWKKVQPTAKGSKYFWITPDPLGGNLFVVWDRYNLAWMVQDRMGVILRGKFKTDAEAKAYVEGEVLPGRK